MTRVVRWLRRGSGERVRSEPATRSCPIFVVPRSYGAVVPNSPSDRALPRGAPSRTPAPPWAPLVSAGFYSAAEAASISRVPLSTLAYWRKTGVLEPSQRKSRPRLYSFEDLRDLRVAQSLRDQGAKPGEIRKVLDYIRGLAEQQPERLAQAELAVVGGVVVYRNRERGIEPVQPSRKGQRVLAVNMAKIFEELGQSASDVAEIRPAPGIVIDPDVRGGTPVLEGTRVPVEVIAELVEDGVALGDIQRMYPTLSEQAIAAAAEWESQLAVAAR